MKNEHKSEITEETVTEAKDDHPLLPSVIGLAVKTLLKKATSAETERYNPELEVVFISYKMVSRNLMSSLPRTFWCKI